MICYVSKVCYDHKINRVIRSELKDVFISYVNSMQKFSIKATIQASCVFVQAMMVRLRLSVAMMGPSLDHLDCMRGLNF